MLRQNEITNEVRVQAWLVLIEHEILLAGASADSPRRGYEEQPLRSDTDVRIERHIPEYLVDEVDNRLKMDGWRLHRPPHPTTGEVRSPNRTRRPNSMSSVMTPDISFFDVVPDVPCDPHDWYPPEEWRPLGTARFCLFCGERGSW